MTRNSFMTSVAPMAAALMLFTGGLSQAGPKKRRNAGGGSAEKRTGHESATSPTDDRNRCIDGGR